jgi:hypothetical protein
MVFENLQGVEAGMTTTWLMVNLQTRVLLRTRDAK